MHLRSVCLLTSWSFHLGFRAPGKQLPKFCPTTNEPVGISNRQRPASPLSIAMSGSGDSTSSENLSHQSSLRENKQGVLRKDLVIVNNVRPVSALSFHVKIFRRTWRSHTWQVLEYLWYPDQTQHLLLYLWSKWSLELRYTSHISICSFFISIWYVWFCLVVYGYAAAYSSAYLNPRGFSGKFLLGWPQGWSFSALYRATAVALNSSSVYGSIRWLLPASYTDWLFSFFPSDK